MSKPFILMTLAVLQLLITGVYSRLRQGGVHDFCTHGTPSCGNYSRPILEPNITEMVLQVNEARQVTLTFCRIYDLHCVPEVTPPADFEVHFANGSAISSYNPALQPYIQFGTIIFKGVDDEYLDEGQIEGCQRTWLDITGVEELHNATIIWRWECSEHGRVENINIASITLKVIPFTIVARGPDEIPGILGLAAPEKGAEKLPVSVPFIAAACATTLTVILVITLTLVVSVRFRHYRKNKVAKNPYDDVIFELESPYSEIAIVPPPLPPRNGEQERYPLEGCIIRPIFVILEDSPYALGCPQPDRKQNQYARIHRTHGNVADSQLEGREPNPVDTVEDSSPVQDVTSCDGEEVIRKERQYARIHRTHTTQSEEDVTSPGDTVDESSRAQDDASPDDEEVTRRERQYTCIHLTHENDKAQKDVTSPGVTVDDSSCAHQNDTSPDCEEVIRKETRIHRTHDSDETQTEEDETRPGDTVDDGSCIQDETAVV